MEKFRGFTVVCPLVSRRPHPPDEKFIPLNVRFLIADVPFRERKVGGLLLKPDNFS